MVNTTTSTRYIEELTGLRGLAAWWVVFYHFREFLFPHVNDDIIIFLSNGYLAVDFFFFLSGFVIFISNANAVSGLHWTQIRIFYLKRLARIYPLHVMTLLGAGCMPLAIYIYSGNYTDSPRYGGWAFVANLLLVDNWGLIDELTWNGPSWSISAEFLSYLLFPLMVVLIFRVGNYPTLLLVLLIGSLGVLALVMYGAGATKIGDRIPEFGAVRCLTQFFAGCILAHLLITYRECIRRWQGAIEMAVIIGLFVVAMGDIPNYWTMPLLFSGVILVISIGRPIYSIFLRNKIIRIFGDISYSTYMIHFIFKDWFKILFVDENMYVNAHVLFFGFLGIFVLSYISYHLVELRFQLAIRYRLRLGRAMPAFQPFGR